MPEYRSSVGPKHFLIATVPWNFPYTVTELLADILTITAAC